MGLSIAFPAFAIPARRTGTPLPAAAAGTETCTQSVRRFTVGPGRRPGATVVPVTLRLQVLGSDGEFTEASADRTRATVAGNDVTLHATVSNLSLYDVGNVIIKHTFKPSVSGPRLQSIGSVSGGAILNERLGSFVIDLVPSDDAVSFTFHLLLSGDINGGLSQSQIRLEDFEVLEAERRFPERTPETPIGRSTQTIERIGIGGTDVACFTGDDGVTRFLPSTSTSPTSPPAARLPAGQGRAGTTTNTSTRREPGPPYLLPSGRSLAEPTASVTPVASLNALVSLEKRASTSEVQPGGSVTYTITVHNRGTETLRDLLVDDRFSSMQLRVVDPQEGQVLPSGIQWIIATLPPGEQWVMRYRAEVLPHLQPGEDIPSTTMLSGGALLDVPTTKRSASLTVSVIGGMPRTGVELRWIILALQVLGGIGIAFLLCALSLSSARFMGRKMEREI